MVSFFNQKNFFKRQLQLINLTAAAIAAFDLITNPDATWGESAVDIVAHAISALALQEDSPLATLLTSTLLNAACLHVVSPDAAVSDEAFFQNPRFPEAVLHLVTGLVTLEATDASGYTARF